MKVDFSAFRSFWLLTFLDLMIYMSFDRIFFAKAVIETVFTLRWAEFLDVLERRVFLLVLGFFWEDVMCKLYLVTCESAFVFCSFGKSIYRLLQRHRCRRGKRCGRLQCADMELLSLLRYRFCDVYMTSCIYIAFWQMVYRKPRFFLLLNALCGFVVDFTVNLRTPSTPLQILVSIVVDFWTCKLLFLWLFVV